jgi:RNA recognition motif-containing protein
MFASLPRTSAHSASRQKSQRAQKLNLVMGNRLFVGNLSFGTTSSTIEALFAAFGEVREVALPTDRETGQARGFAFVTMGNAHAAADAMAQLNGHNLEGRSIKVDEAQERQRSGGGGGRRDRY